MPSLLADNMVDELSVTTKHTGAQAVAADAKTADTVYLSCTPALSPKLVQNPAKS